MEQKKEDHLKNKLEVAILQDFIKEMYLVML